MFLFLFIFFFFFSTVGLHNIAFRQIYIEKKYSETETQDIQIKKIFFVNVNKIFWVGAILVGRSDDSKQRIF